MIEKICRNCQRFPCLKNSGMALDDECGFSDDFKPKEKLVATQYRKDGKLEGKIIPGKVADDIMDDMYFICTRDNEELFYYNDGVYHSVGAEALIKGMVEIGLEEDTTEHIINETINHIKRNRFINREEINKDKNLIHLENGIFDLDTMEIGPFLSNTYSTVKLPVIYDKDADCPEIKKFISEIVDTNDIPIIQELFGYILLKNYPIQKAFVFLGDGANGKSTVLRLIEKFVGKENVSGIALQDLEPNRFAVASLYGKLVNMFADLPDKAMYQTGKFKMVTGGDIIYAEKKFKGHFSFVNYAKLIYSANKLPEARDDTSAFFRRWIMINFPNTFEGEKCNKNILEKLTTENELSGLFNWAIEGLKRLLTNQEFSNSKTTDEIRDQYERLSSPLAAFIKDCIEISTDGSITKDDFYTAYVVYCKDHNLPIKAKNIVGRDIGMYLPHISSGRATEKNKNGIRPHIWQGIRFIQDVQDVQAFLHPNCIENNLYSKGGKSVDNLDKQDDQTNLDNLDKHSKQQDQEGLL